MDTYPDDSGNEQAWLGLVPFRMEGVTPRHIPEIPGIHAFPETNIRTYVHRDGQEPGVWFFSLDAANTLACKIARKFFHLPYFEARMSVQESPSGIAYRSSRRSSGATCEANCVPVGDLFSAEPGTLEFFLAERYLLYSRSPRGIHTGRVFHTPYRLQRLESVSIKETLVEAAEIPSKPFHHYLFSPGVDVDVYRLSPSLRVG